MPFVGGPSTGGGIPHIIIKAGASPPSEAQAQTDEWWIENELPCVHRGEKAGLSVCTTCGSKGKPLQLWECRLHGEVSILNKNRNIKSCYRCSTRKEQ